MPSTSKILTSLLISKQIREIIEKGERIDGRDPQGFRNITIRPGEVKKADGSAYVALGDTTVVAGVKFELGTPFPDTPNKGIMIVEGEMLPFASLEAEPGPPTSKEVELSRVVDRGVRESGMVDLEKFVIEPGQKVIKMFIDFSILNDAGNLIDASSLAAAASLLCADYPNPQELIEDPSATVENVSKIPLEVKDLPTSVTFADLFGHLVVDPTAEEEIAMRSQLTITHMKNDKICAIQKSGSGDLPFEKVFEAEEVARDKSKALRDIVIGAVEGREIT